MTPRAYADAFIKKVVDEYQQWSDEATSEDTSPHLLLAMVFMVHKKATGVTDDDGNLFKVAMPSVYPFSLLKSPDCAEAMGIWLLRQEHPIIVSMLPAIRSRFRELMAPVWEARRQGREEQIYGLRNAGMVRLVRRAVEPLIEEAKAKAAG